MWEFVREIVLGEYIQMIVSVLALYFAILAVLQTGMGQKILAKLPTKLLSVFEVNDERIMAVDDISKSMDVENLPFEIRTVFFGTNRSIDDTAKDLRFTDKRSDELKTGLAEISVPQKRKLGTVKRPKALAVAGLQLWQQDEDPKKHFIIVNLKQLEQNEFCRLAQEQISCAERFENSAFLFIHGFNVTFENALFRAAQMAHDLNFDGPAFVYSWPAVGSAANYLTDMDSAALAAPHLDKFIDMILKHTDVEKLHLVVHSMGNAALAKLMQSTGTKLSERQGKSIDQLILAAPDIDIGVFNQVAQHFTQHSNGVTLYACSTDKALLMSKKIRNDYPRAGDVPADGPAVFPDIDTIDVSAVGTSFFAFNHSVYAEDRGVLDDIGQLMLRGEHPPSLRMPTLKFNEFGNYWVMPD